MTESGGTLAGRRIVVGVAGSIAAYKAVALVRLLMERGAVVDVAMTPSATSFVGPLTFESLTHRPVVDDVLELDGDQQIAHIDLAEAADGAVRLVRGDAMVSLAQRAHLGEGAPTIRGVVVDDPLPIRVALRLQRA